MTTNDPPDQELVITRLLDAPRELVYACWTQPEHLARWGGCPEGLSVDIEFQDIRVDGMFRVRMRSPHGIDCRLQGTYRELVRPERIVFTHAWVLEDGSLAPETLVTITLKPAGRTMEKTELTLRQTGLPSKASRDGHREGWDSTLDRLTDYISKSTA